MVSIGMNRSSGEAGDELQRHFTLDGMTIESSGNELSSISTTRSIVKKPHEMEPLKVPSTGATLQDMPNEILAQIFQYLNKIDSTCLSVVRKRFYAIQFYEKGKVHLDSYGSEGSKLCTAESWAKRCLKCTSDFPTMSSVLPQCMLWRHLADWMPAKLSFCPTCRKFAPARARAHSCINCQSNPTVNILKKQRGWTYRFRKTAEKN